MTMATDSQAAAQPSDALDAPALLELLRQMLLIRRFEERTMQSYQQAKIGGFCHIYVGQEATAVGSIDALNDDDPIITAYRDHGHALARGLDPNYAMAEMFGKITGCSKGKGGSMHLFDKPHHMYGGHAIVGGQCPMGVGLAFAIQYNKEEKVCVTYLGDGALNQGAFHESMNLAAIWNLPIIICVENNQYSMGTSIERGTAMAHDLKAKADAYGMQYGECDGQDVLDTYNCFKTLADDVRGGGKPAFVNANTYRYQGHSMSDPQKYRSKEEVKEHQELDCVNRLVNYVIENGMATQDEIDELNADAKKIAVDSVKFANQSADTPIEELYTDVYAEPFEPFKKGGLPDLMKE